MRRSQTGLPCFGFMRWVLTMFTFAEAKNASGSGTGSVSGNGSESGKENENGKSANGNGKKRGKESGRGRGNGDILKSSCLKKKSVVTRCLLWGICLLQGSAGARARAGAGKGNARAGARTRPVSVHMHLHVSQAHYSVTSRDDSCTNVGYSYFTVLYVMPVVAAFLVQSVSSHRNICTFRGTRLRLV